MERLVTHIKPKVFENYVDLGKARVVFDNKKYKVTVEEMSYRNTYNTKDLDTYLIDFTPIANKETHFEFSIEIK